MQTSANTKAIAPAPRLSNADREGFFRASRYRIRQDQNAAFGFDPGVCFVEGERALNPT